MKAKRQPLGGYAPGGYNAGNCVCGEPLRNVDKRASECFYCAVEHVNARIAELEGQREVDAGLAEGRNLVIKNLEARNAKLVEALTWIADNYANIFIGHQDFRVEAYAKASDVLQVSDAPKWISDAIEASAIKNKGE